MFEVGKLLRTTEPGPDRIAVFGDVHGRVNQLTWCIEDFDVRIAILCGDCFGFGEKAMERMKVLYEITPNCEYYWCDGNHEAHDWIKLMIDLHGRENPITPAEAPNVHYMPRGSKLELPDGRIALFAGGAVSIDRAWRTEGETWFPQEILTMDYLEHVKKEKVDILITHTCGRVNLMKMLPFNQDKCIDASYDAIDWLLDQVDPDLWYFGHWHQFFQGEFGHTKWTALDRDGRQDWGIWLPEGGYDAKD